MQRPFQTFPDLSSPGRSAASALPCPRNCLVAGKLPYDPRHHHVKDETFFYRSRSVIPSGWGARTDPLTWLCMPCVQQHPSGSGLAAASRISEDQTAPCSQHLLHPFVSMQSRHTEVGPVPCGVLRAPGALQAPAWDNVSTSGK
ncbi:hypothetical protein DV515_00014541 [Chloebia gouldiae]|uniref:Uncharacterized protein n=1 Tax=Chloebia gouldiae TaxID=44316 RepID=A0A3L8RXP3_CHLGU|nr:hypothetical protein DV515_00014541 [Chloebia gouldiae]